MKEETQVKMKVIYYSTDKHPFVPMLVPENMADIGNTYPLTTTAPDPSLKSPKYNWSTFEWYENDNQETAEQLGILTKTVAELQKNQQTETQNNQANDKKMDKVIQLVTMTNLNLGKLMKNSQEQETAPTTEGGKE